MTKPGEAGEGNHVERFKDFHLFFHPGKLFSKFEATLGIRSPGESKFWFDPVKVPVTLALEMPTLGSQESSPSSVALNINTVEGAASYKIRRTDKQDVQSFTGTTFSDHDVQPARKYTYEFWAEGGQLKSAKNTITIWTKPANPSLTVQKVTNTGFALNVVLNGNPEDVLVEVKREGGSPSVKGLSVEESGLTEDTDYTYEIRVKSANNEYSGWVTQTFRTGDGNQEFYDNVQTIVSTVVYKVDGDKKAKKAWVEVSVSDTKGLQVEGEVNGERKQLGSSPVRFENLELDTEYPLTVVVKDAKRTTQQKVTFRTPSFPEPSIPTTPPTSNPDEEFNKKVEKLLETVKYEVGNSEKRHGWM
ncbi:hypothetical protein B5G50_15575 [Brevibacillus brevis]|nr:hypothetical protein B5G50_15575 [Brevibacillus brevis]